MGGSASEGEDGDSISRTLSNLLQQGFSKSRHFVIGYEWNKSQNEAGKNREKMQGSRGDSPPIWFPQFGTIEPGAPRAGYTKKQSCGVLACGSKLTHYY